MAEYKERASARVENLMRGTVIFRDASTSVNKRFGRVEDCSLEGIRFLCQADLPTDRVWFQLDKNPDRILEVHLVRRDHVFSNHYQYAGRIVSIKSDNDPSSHFGIPYSVYDWQAARRD